MCALGPAEGAGTPRTGPLDIVPRRGTALHRADPAVIAQIGPGGAQALEGGVPVPVKSADDFTAICGYLSKVFTGTVVTKDFRVFIRESFENSPDIKWHIADSKKQLKEMLAGLTGYSASDITDEALDYLFGNQDGTLDEKDFQIDTKQLIGRLQFLIEVFTTNSRSGGPNPFQILILDNLVAVDFESEVPGYMGKIDLQALSDAKDPLYTNSLIAAATAYMNSDLVKDPDKLAFLPQYKALVDGGIMPDPAKLPVALKKLLFVAFFNSFYNATVTNDLFIPIKLANKDPEFRKALFEGAFIDYIEGHGDKKDPDAITHNLPKDFDIKTLQTLAAERQAQKAALAKAKGERPAPAETTLPSGPLLAPSEK